MPGPTKKPVRRLVRGDYVTVRDNANIDRVVGIHFMAEPDDGIVLTLLPIDGSDGYQCEFPDPTEFVKMGWGVTVGLPVSIMADDRGNLIAEVDWSELDSAVAEQTDDRGIKRVVDQWVTAHEVLPVAFPKGSRPIKRCPRCGSPVTEWHEPQFDGDSEPRSECLVSGCYGSTY